MDRKVRHFKGDFALRRQGVSVGSIALAALVVAMPAAADDFQLHGYADVRLVSPSDEQSWLEGGLGKLRFNDTEDRDVDIRLAEIVLEGSAQLTPELNAFASLRYAENQRSPVDLVEAYLRYRPVSTEAWRWSVKAGAFFPPISLENDEIGWTSTWTLTPSAINTWVGEEFRTIGAEGKVELRGDVDTFEATAAIFGWNDPAGVLIGHRGWALHDRPTSLFDHPREADAFALSTGRPVPFYTAMFKEIDDEPGWYAGLSWRREDLGRLNVLFYDNRADPSAVRGQIAWRTEFWNLGVETQIGEITIIAQGMTGETEVAPSIFFNMLTRFSSAFLLGGWQRDDWRLAARAEIFATDQINRFGPLVAEGRGREHGHALTFDATWLPEDWLRVSGEVLFVHSYRPQRLVTGPTPTADETQVQLSARLYF